MPIITSDTPVSDISFVKFVRVGDTIAFDEDAHKKHARIAIENGLVADLGVNIKPTVDDGGFIWNENKKIFPRDTTDTCVVQGDEHDQRKMTREILVNLLGAERVK